MNVLSKSPVWAQPTLTKLADFQSVEGLEKQPFDQDKFEQFGEKIVGVVKLMSFLDEVEGSDMAMGQPGVVAQERFTLHYEGDPRGYKLEGMLHEINQEKSAEMVYYVNKADGEVEAFGLAQVGDTILAQGAVVSPTQSGELDGYIIKGQVQ